MALAIGCRKVIPWQEYQDAKTRGPEQIRILMNRNHIPTDKAKVAHCPQGYHLIFTWKEYYA